MHCVMETDPFARQAKAVGLSDEDRQRIATILSEDPRAGELIPEMGGARKMRLAKPGRGKSGLSHNHLLRRKRCAGLPARLLDKGHRLNLTQNEKNELRKLLAGIATDYRQSVAEKVAKVSEVS